MITKNTYYKNEFYIPLAKPSVTSNVTSVSSELDAFIWKYERKFLVRCFGLVMAKVFMDSLDKTKDNGLKDLADEKWNRLLNGHSYTDPQGDDVEWLGLRRKAIPSDIEPSISVLVNYVYYYWEKSKSQISTGVGHGKAKAKNFVEVSAGPKVVFAWREMVDVIQGRDATRKEYFTLMGWGVDYFNENQEKTLYQFIEDMNSLEGDTYYNKFVKTDWETKVNQFGI